MDTITLLVSPFFFVTCNIVVVALFQWNFFFLRLRFTFNIYLCDEHRWPKKATLALDQGLGFQGLGFILFQSILDSSLIETCNIAQNASLNGNGPPIQLIQSIPFFSQHTQVHLCNGWMHFGLGHSHIKIVVDFNPFWVSSSYPSLHMQKEPNCFQTLGLCTDPPTTPLKWWDTSKNNLLVSPGLPTGSYKVQSCSSNTRRRQAPPKHFSS